MKNFPKNEISVEVCKHRFGRDLTVTEQTDKIYVRYPIEYYGFKRNIRTGAFVGIHNRTSDWMDVELFEKQGNIRSDVYLNVGEVAADYPSAMVIILPWFELKTGRKPSTASFAGGNQSLAPMIVQHFLGGRNSDIGQSNYENYNQTVWQNMNSTTRWLNVEMNGSQGDGLTWPEVANELTTVANAGGWFRNFTHWQDLSVNGVIYKQDEFYETILTTLSNIGKTAHFCSFGEAVEYAAFRDLTKRAHCYKSSNGRLRIALDFDGLEDVLVVGQYATEKSLFLQDRLNTPLSVKIDLTGTEFEGKDFEVENGDIIKVSANEFIVNIPFKFDDSTTKIIYSELIETTEPIYRTFDQPQGTATVEGTTLQIEVETPCRMVVFQKTKAQAEELYTLKERQLILKNSHTFENFDFTNYDYKVGIIDEWQNQNLI